MEKIFRKIVWELEKRGIFIRKIQPRLSTNLIRKLGRDLIGVEIGVDKGENSRILLKELLIEKLFLVDVLIKPEVKRLAEADKRVIIYNGSSDWAAKKINTTLDFVYIDGDHSYNQVKKDIKNYYAKIKGGGVLSGHDINQSDVFRAVSEFAVKNKLNVEVDFQDWVIQKPK